MAVELTRGQRAKIPDAVVAAPTSVRVELEAPGVQELPCFALITDVNEAILGGDQMVYADGGASRCGGLRAEGAVPAAFAIDFAKLPPEAHRMVFGFGVTEAGRARGLDASSIRNATVSLGDAFTFKIAGGDLQKETALVLFEVSRKDGWRVTGSAVGFVGGLPSLISRYRGDPAALVRRPPPPVQAPPVVAPAAKVAGRACATVPFRWATRTEPNVPTSLIPAVGLVVVQRADTTATGTGFMIGPGGYFLTCAHVVEGQLSIGIRLEGTGTVRPATLVATDDDGDVALLHVDDRDGVTDWLLLEGSEHSPQLGDNLGLLGYPLGGDLGISLTYSQGVINSMRKHEGIPVLQVDTGAAPGSSGGPVFRRSDGKVVGLLTSGLSRANQGMLVNFAVDIRRVWQLGWVK